ncbi:Envelope fusion protein, partial [Aphis craccivora]
ELSAQLKDIKTNLPSNLNLPIEINAKNYFEFMKLININIYYVNHLIIFSEREFLASYIFFTQNQINKCKTTKQKLICESNTPISNNIQSSCEFQLFTKENNMPENCEIRTAPIFNDIWHQLGNNEVENIEINKAGILSLKSNCKAFTKKNVILAKYTGKSNFSKDYVPQFHLSKLTEDFNDKIKKNTKRGCKSN